MSYIGLSGLPVIEQIDTFRNELFKVSSDWEEKGSASATRVIGWIGHKCVSLISFPLDILELGVCTVGMVVCACTLGALKVAVFSCTLGHKPLKFSAGVCWFGERALHGATGCAFTIAELAYDGGQVVYQGFRGVRWLSQQLHLDVALKKVISCLGRFFSFMGERLMLGFENAAQHEAQDCLSGETPYLLKPLDDLTKSFRIDCASDERPFTAILAHTALSIPNILMNTIAAVPCIVASALLSVAFLAKALLYALTNIDIPVPTYAGYALNGAYTTVRNVIYDAGSDIGDIFVTIYKIAKLTRLLDALITLSTLLAYIPVACCDLDQ